MEDRQWYSHRQVGPRGDCLCNQFVEDTVREYRNWSQCHTTYNTSYRTTLRLMQLLMTKFCCLHWLCKPNFTDSAEFGLINSSLHLLSEHTLSSLSKRSMCVSRPNCFPAKAVALAWFDWSPPQVTKQSQSLSRASAIKNSNLRT